MVQNIQLGAYVYEHENIKINILQVGQMCNIAWDQVTQ